MATFYQRFRIPKLALIKNTLQRRFFGLDEEINLFLKFGNVCIMFGKTSINLIF